MGASANALLKLILARGRRRPSRWLPAATGIALAAAFGGAVLVESTIAADQSARSALVASSPLDRTVRVSWTGVLTPAVQRTARGVFQRLGLGRPTEVVVLNPVRLGGVVVRLAAIAELRSWTDHDPPGRCLPSACPMLLAGGAAPYLPLAAPGVHIPVVGRVSLRSAVPLGFTAGSTDPPLFVTADVTGLERLPGLSSLYRTHSWVAPELTRGLHAWQLAGTERRLAQEQAALPGSDQLSFVAPFASLDTARSLAAAAPRRLLLAGGGALAALGLFVVLAAGGLRRDQEIELSRLRTAGAKAGHSVAFVVGEAALLCGFATVLGACIALGAGALLADAAGAPVGGVLAHSLLVPAGAVALAAFWAGATMLVSGLLFASGNRMADLVAVAAAVGLTLALVRAPGRSDPLPVLVAPLCCVAAGVLVFRCAAGLLKGAERVARRGPVLVRLALVGLARAPAGQSLAIAFIAVSTGLGGFALAYRATLVRGAADQAADRVPLDAIVAPDPGFVRPLELAPLACWQSLANGSAAPVRRTEATFLSGGASVTVPALGVPAGTLPHLRSWRPGDASQRPDVLARRLSPTGPTRVAGPMLPVSSRTLSVTISAEVAVSVTADLRDPSGAIHQIPLGSPGRLGGALSARVPPGNWELDALELQQPTGLEQTNGHQNAESPAPATRFSSRIRIGPVRSLDRLGAEVLRISIGGWRALGAATLSGSRGEETDLRFAESGSTGILRPPQPSDARPVPVLVDPQTHASSGRGGRLALTIDGLLVTAQVVGVLSRFPTTSPNAAGFVVADEQTLSDALDAQAPGQGRPDELWISTANLSRLRAASRGGPLSQLSFSFRRDLERGLRSAPIAHAVLGALTGAAALSAILALLGLLVSLAGPARDERIERDLAAQGMGPIGLCRELRIRLLLAGTAGVAAGVGIAALLTRLAVASVRAAGTTESPRPPLLVLAPWAQLALWAAVALGALALASLAATRSRAGRRPAS